MTAALAAAGWLYASYRRDIDDAYRQLEQVARERLDTALGPIEYAVRGEGQPVLVIHGNAGGADQALELARDNLGSGFKAVVPSRFGYLGTPMPRGASPSNQADVYASLLDALEVEAAAVLDYSAGGPSAVPLALRHPQRVAALALVSTAISPAPVALPPRPVIRVIFGSDFLTWLITHPLGAVTRRMFVSGSYELSASEERELAQTMDDILPARPRADGILFDMYVTNTDPSRESSSYPLEEIETPTLIVNARDDPAADYGAARRMADRIPQASFVSVPDGGHLMLGSGDRVRNRIRRFLAAHWK